mgnify:CR=1 FL=1
MTHTSSHGCLLHFARRLKSPRLTNRVMGAFSIRREGPHLNQLRWILVMPMTHNSSHGRLLYPSTSKALTSIRRGGVVDPMTHHSSHGCLLYPSRWFCGSDHGTHQYIGCVLHSPPLKKASPLCFERMQGIICVNYILKLPQDGTLLP